MYNSKQFNIIILEKYNEKIVNFISIDFCTSVFCRQLGQNSIKFKIKTKDVLQSNTELTLLVLIVMKLINHGKCHIKLIIGDWIINTREKDGKIELRPRFQVKLFEQENGFYFRPRVEYRDRRGKEEYFRLWTTLGWNGNYSCNSDFVCCTCYSI